MSKPELRPDIEAAKNRMSVRLGSGREIKKLVGYLWEDEQVHSMTSGMYGSGAGLVVMTDRRLLFVKDGVMTKTTEDFPYSKISSVAWSSTLGTGTIVVFASGNKAEIKAVPKNDGKAMVNALRERLADTPAAPTSAPAAAAAPASPDVYEQLARLGELRDKGILDDDEFATQKAKLLS